MRVHEQRANGQQWPMGAVSGVANKKKTQAVVTQNSNLTQKRSWTIDDIIIMAILSVRFLFVDWDSGCNY